MSPLVTVRVFRDPLEAVAAKDTLAAEGIGSMVVYEPPVPLNAHHHYPTLESAELQVREEDREKALAVLDGAGPARA